RALSIYSALMEPLQEARERQDLNAPMAKLVAAQINSVTSTDLGTLAPTKFVHRLGPALIPFPGRFDLDEDEFGRPGKSLLPCLDHQVDLDTAGYPVIKEVAVSSEIMIVGP